MHLLIVLEQPRPKFLLELLLAQHQLNVAAGMVNLGFLGVNLGVEFELDGIGDLLGRRGALEAQLGGLQVKLLV